MSGRIVIGGASAFQFWRGAGSGGRFSARPTRATLSKGAPTSAELAFHRIPGRCWVDDKVELLVSDPASRRTGKQVSCRVISRALPEGALFAIAPGLYVAAPELCLLQLAARLPAQHGIALGMELCGSYALDDESVTGFTAREPVTSALRIARFARAFLGPQSGAAAARCLPWIFDGSASPSESAQAMCFCLPPRLGGYGFPAPQLNRRIDFTPEEQRRYGHDHFVCDLYWPDQRVALEYDSRMYHTDAEKQERDAARRNALLAKGVTLMVTTRDKLYDSWKFDQHARQVAQVMHKRLHVGNAKFFEQRELLRNSMRVDPLKDAL